MKKGFTLIELVFVIMIIGILAAISIHKLEAQKKQKEEQKNVQPKENFRKQEPSKIEIK